MFNKISKLNQNITVAIYTYIILMLSVACTEKLDKTLLSNPDKDLQHSTHLCLNITNWEQAIQSNSLDVVKCFYQYTLKADKEMLFIKSNEKQTPLVIALTNKTDESIIQYLVSFVSGPENLLKLSDISDFLLSNKYSSDEKLSIFPIIFGRQIVKKFGGQIVKKLFNKDPVVLLFENLLKKEKKENSDYPLTIFFLQTVNDTSFPDNQKLKIKIQKLIQKLLSFDFKKNRLKLYCDSKKSTQIQSWISLMNINDIKTIISLNESDELKKKDSQKLTKCILNAIESQPTNNLDVLIKKWFIDALKDIRIYDKIILWIYKNWLSKEDRKLDEQDLNHINSNLMNDFLKNKNKKMVDVWKWLFKQIDNSDKFKFFIKNITQNPEGEADKYINTWMSNQITFDSSIITHLTPEEMLVIRSNSSLLEDRINQMKQLDIPTNSEITKKINFAKWLNDSKHLLDSSIITHLTYNKILKFYKHDKKAAASLFGSDNINSNASQWFLEGIQNGEFKFANWLMKRDIKLTQLTFEKIDYKDMLSLYNHGDGTLTIVAQAKKSLAIGEAKLNQWFLESIQDSEFEFANWLMRRDIKLTQLTFENIDYKNMLSLYNHGDGWWTDDFSILEFIVAQAKSLAIGEAKLSQWLLEKSIQNTKFHGWLLNEIGEK